MLLVCREWMPAVVCSFVLKEEKAEQNASLQPAIRLGEGFFQAACEPCPVPECFFPWPVDSQAPGFPKTTAFFPDFHVCVHSW